MKFTLVFPSEEAEDLSIAALFTPCLTWYEGQRELLNPHPEDPGYRRGDLQRLFADEILAKRIAGHSKKVVLVAHNNGHGTEQNLTDLTADLSELGYISELIRL